MSHKTIRDINQTLENLVRQQARLEVLYDAPLLNRKFTAPVTLDPDKNEVRLWIENETKMQILNEWDPGEQVQCFFSIEGGQGKSFKAQWKGLELCEGDDLNWVGKLSLPEEIEHGQRREVIRYQPCEEDFIFASIRPCKQAGLKGALQIPFEPFRTQIHDLSMHGVKLFCPNVLEVAEPLVLGQGVELAIRFPVGEKEVEQQRILVQGVLRSFCESDTGNYLGFEFNNLQEQEGIYGAERILTSYLKRLGATNMRAVEARAA